MCNGDTIGQPTPCTPGGNTGGCINLTRNTYDLQNDKLGSCFPEKGAGCAIAIRNFRGRYKSVFINSAVAFMAIKIGLIFLATFATNGLLLKHGKPIPSNGDV